MIRRLQKCDGERVREIVKTIWEGDDYIPHVFEKWVEDPSCHFMGLWKDGTLVGIDNLRLLSDKVGWMEGMRIDPALQGKGFGKELGKQTLAIAKRIGLERLYFATYFDNTASIRMNEAFGFNRIGVFTNLESEIGDISDSSFAFNVDSEIPEILDHVSEDWAFLPKEIPDKARFLIQPTRIHDGDNWAVLSKNSKSESCVDINYISIVEERKARSFVHGLKCYAQSKGFERVHTMVREDLDLEPFLYNGFKPFERVKDVFLYFADSLALEI
ncbi:MAG TPA: GNAT family N-acetyltransferase [Mesotoga prima]|uniref:GNAT family N-acetyltransferase n=1 Tax=Mesotoga prima TaxID=1184387 RepID=UPI002BA9636F|nr:GNAT family N-acetyltransferase [Mesotoga prima]HPE52655.1 GNAT family N-acetyltransferase [Mesotoga prima]